MLLTNPKTGETIESALTDDEARAVCLNEGDFARDLAGRTSLSPAQRFWLHKMAGEPLPAGSYTRLMTMFLKAVKAGLKYPDIICRTPEGTVRWQLGKDGQVWIKCGQRSSGRITARNTLIRFRGMAPLTYELTKVLCENPLAAARLWGQRTSRCCFCNLPLETPESVTAGYGPVCAENWGLPWGEVGDVRCLF